MNSHAMQAINQLKAHKKALHSFSLEPVFRYLVGKLVHLTYKPQFFNFDILPAHGPAIIICNHVSYVDGLIVTAGCKRPVRFVIDGEIYSLPLVNYFMRLNRAIPILPKRESVEAALDSISEGLKAGDIICIFPEGQLTYTGSLSRFRPGIESIIKRDPVPVYPMAIRGLWGSVFSRKYLRAKFRWFPRHRHLHVKAICGAAIPPEEVTVNHLQEIVLRLKYSITD